MTDYRYERLYNHKNLHVSFTLRLDAALD